MGVGNDTEMGVFAGSIRVGYKEKPATIVTFGPFGRSQEETLKYLVSNILHTPGVRVAWNVKRKLELSTKRAHH